MDMFKYYSHEVRLQRVNLGVRTGYRREFHIFPDSLENAKIKTGPDIFSRIYSQILIQNYISIQNF